MSLRKSPEEQLAEVLSNIFGAGVSVKKDDCDCPGCVMRRAAVADKTLGPEKAAVEANKQFAKTDLQAKERAAAVEASAQSAQKDRNVEKVKPAKIDIGAFAYEGHGNHIHIVVEADQEQNTRSVMVEGKGVHIATDDDGNQVLMFTGPAFQEYMQFMRKITAS